MQNSQAFTIIYGIPERRQSTKMNTFITTQGKKKKKIDRTEKESGLC